MHAYRRVLARARAPLSRSWGILSGVPVNYAWSRQSFSKLVPLSVPIIAATGSTGEHGSPHDGARQPVPPVQANANQQLCCSFLPL